VNSEHMLVLSEVLF